jgi:hypothetical protein
MSCDNVIRVGLHIWCESERYLYMMRTSRWEDVWSDRRLAEISWCHAKSRLHCHGPAIASSHRSSSFDTSLPVAARLSLVNSQDSAGDVLSVVPMNPRDQGRGEMWSNNQHTTATSSSGLAISVPTDSEPNRLRKDRRSPTMQSSGPSSAPASNNPNRPGRPDIPTRASTTGSNTEPERSATDVSIPKVRSEDLNHSGPGFPYNPSGSPLESSTTLFSNSTRPTTPSSSQQNHQQGAATADEITSVASHSSASSNLSNSPRLQRSVSATLASTFVYLHNAHSHDLIILLFFLQDMFRLWETHARCFCSSAWYSLSPQLLQVHGETLLTGGANTLPYYSTLGLW